MENGEQFRNRLLGQFFGVLKKHSLWDSLIAKIKEKAFEMKSINLWKNKEKIKDLYEDLVKKNDGHETKALYAMLAMMKEDVETLQETEEISDIVLEIIEEMHSKKSYLYAEGLYFKGMCMMDHDEFRRAIQIFRDVINILKQVNEETHPLQIADTYNKIAFCNLNLEETKEAIEAAEKAHKYALSGNHTNSYPEAISLYLLAKLHKDTGDYANALMYFKQAVSKLSNHFKENHAIIQDVKSSIEILERSIEKR